MSTTVTEQVMDQAEARRLTERIRIAAVNYSEAKEKLLRLVSEAKDGSAHVALGYRSWQAYLSEVLGEEPMRLTRDERPEVVQMLTAEGMSTRAIAPIIGADQKTVVNDRRKTEEYSSVDEPRVSHGMDGKTRVHQPRTAPSAPSAASAPTVTGMDGKEYSRPTPPPLPPTEGTEPPSEPTKRKRRPITETAHDAGWEASRNAERIERIIADDRFSRNKEEVAAKLRSHLNYAITTYTEILEQLDTERS